MQKFIRLLPVLILLFAESSFSQSSGHKNEQYELKKICIEQVNRNTAALVARDWLQLTNEADRFIKNCGSILGNEFLAQAHQRKMDAYEFLQLPSKALKSSDDCLNSYYGNTGCHLGRTFALIQLKRYQEAKVSLDRADKLITVSLHNIERDLLRPQHYLDRELSQSRQNEIKSHQELAFELHKRLNVDLLENNSSN